MSNSSSSSFLLLDADIPSLALPVHLTSTSSSTIASLPSCKALLPQLSEELSLRRSSSPKVSRLRSSSCSDARADPPFSQVLSMERPSSLKSESITRLVESFLSFLEIVDRRAHSVSSFSLFRTRWTALSVSIGQT